MILNQQAYFLGLNTSLLKDNLKISLEFFHAVISVDTRREEVHVEHMSNKLCGGLSADTRSTCHQQASSRLGKSPFSESNQLKNIIEQVNVHLLEFSLVSSQRLLDQLYEIGLGYSSKGRNTLDDSLSLRSNLTNEKCVDQLFIVFKVISK